jgi:hypothetical protein
MWTYSQSTGRLTDKDGKLAAVGYSGRAGSARNNPNSQALHNVGPIPRGHYSIGQAHQSEHTGPLTMDLKPSRETNTFGRSLFRIHGDNMIHDASEGCIIMPRNVREDLATSSDKLLEVVE